MIPIHLLLLVISICGWTIGYHCCHGMSITEPSNRKCYNNIVDSSSYISSSSSSSSSSSPVSKSSSSHPPGPPPWSFLASRIHYQLKAIPTKVALQTSIPSHDKVSLLSIGGYTLGGIFAVQYDVSPIGPYNEVAVLSGLIRKGINIGAWASHVYVDSDEAALYGRDIWGLPTDVVPIHFIHSSSSPPSSSRPRQEEGKREKTVADNDDDIGSTLWGSTAACAVSQMNVTSIRFLKEASRIVVEGWRKDSNNNNDVDVEKAVKFRKRKEEEEEEDSITINPSSISRGLLGLLDIALPSFSGCLRQKNNLSDDGSNGVKISPLLQYPLRIAKPAYISFRPEEESACIVESDSTNRVTGTNNSEKDDLLLFKELVESPTLFSVDIGRVELTAGKPVIVEQ